MGFCLLIFRELGGNQAKPFYNQRVQLVNFRWIFYKENEEKVVGNLDAIVSLTVNNLEKLIFIFHLLYLFFFQFSEASAQLNCETPQAH
ncbi:CLUMA_CG018576, isoform A [Clunio marinus]|uniref:CLUMA_CG018576, isoform A n=1 Tax=Clunio marinus TaxID=568069 RepID=A0A1J1J0G4_9DIPT|nr:CLUMA_CG018576, isoform A [Clunio marinus]